MELSVDKQERLRALRRAFAGQLPGMVRGIEAACADAASLAAALRGAHTLAGTAGTYGLLEVSAEARALEELLREGAPAPACVAARLERLKEAARRDLGAL